MAAGVLVTILLYLINSIYQYRNKRGVYDHLVAVNFEYKLIWNNWAFNCEMLLDVQIKGGTIIFSDSLLIL